MRSKPLSLLILIASALFLSAAGSAGETSPSPSPPKRQSAETTENKGQTNVGPVLAVGDKSGAEPSAAETERYTGSGYYPEQQTMPAVWFQIVTTILLLFFTGGLWWTSIRQWRAMRAALHTNRPFLIVSEVEVGDGDLFDDWPAVKVQNLGTGPADIVEVMGASSLFDIPTDRRGDSAFDLVEQRSADSLRTAAYVISATSAPIELCRIPVTPMDEAIAIEPSDKTEKTTKILCLYGRIRYKGGAPDEMYETNFFWWYLAAESVIEYKGFFLRGPDRLNHRT